MTREAYRLPLPWSGARVAESVDALDLGSSAPGRGGSSPPSRTFRASRCGGSDRALLPGLLPQPREQQVEAREELLGVVVHGERVLSVVLAAAVGVLASWGALSFTTSRTVEGA